MPPVIKLSDQNELVEIAEWVSYTLTGFIF